MLLEKYGVLNMGVFLSVIDDDFNKEKDFGYIEDYCLNLIIKKSNENSMIYFSDILSYENTVFNSAQVEGLKIELEKLLSCFEDKKILDILINISNAIDFSKKDPPSYLFFDGD